MNLLVKLAKIAGYGQPLKGGKDLFNGGTHVDPLKVSRGEEDINRKKGKDLFSGGAHRGKPHQHRPKPRLDHGSGDNDWCY